MVNQEAMISSREVSSCTQGTDAEEMDAQETYDVCEDMFSQTSCEM